MITEREREDEKEIRRRHRCIRTYTATVVVSDAANEAVSEAFDTAYPFGRGEGWGPFDATGAAGEVDD
jgi:hypothetical protein